MMEERISHYCWLVAVKTEISMDIVLLDDGIDVQVGDLVLTRWDDYGDLEGTVVDRLWTERDGDVVRWLNYTGDIGSGKVLRIVRPIWERELC